MYHDTVFIGVVVPYSAVARAFLCLLSVLVLQTDVLPLRVLSWDFVVKVSNAEASQLKDRVN